jgi:hypothetical protein
MESFQEFVVNWVFVTIVILLIVIWGFNILHALSILYYRIFLVKFETSLERSIRMDKQFKKIQSWYIFKQRVKKLFRWR